MKRHLSRTMKARTLPILLISSLLLLIAVPDTLPSRHNSHEHKISNASQHSVETMGQPTKLPNPQLVSTAYIPLQRIAQTSDESRVGSHLYLSPNVTLLPTHLVYTLTTSSQL